jgi:hypothetical protein
MTQPSYVRQASVAWDNNSTTSPNCSIDSTGCDYLQIDIVFRNTGSTTISGTTHNGDTCNHHETVFSTASPRMDSEIYYRIAPDIGTFNVVVTSSAAIGGAGNDGTITVTGYTNVHQTTPLGTSATYEAISPFSALDVTVPGTTTNDVAHDVIGINGPAATVAETADGGQTAHGEVAGGLVITTNTSTKAGATTSTAMGWDYTPSAAYNAFQRGVAIKGTTAPSTHAGPLANGALIKNLVNGALVA